MELGRSHKISKSLKKSEEFNLKSELFWQPGAGEGVTILCCNDICILMGSRQINWTPQGNIFSTIWKWSHLNWNTQKNIIKQPEEISVIYAFFYLKVLTFYNGGLLIKLQKIYIVVLILQNDLSLQQLPLEF